MNFPTITLIYLAILSLIYSLLALIVVAQRRKNKTPFGDGGHESLHRAIRAHGNFIEWVPLAALLVAALESLGEAIAHIHWLMGALLVARVLHPIGLASVLGSLRYRVGRIVGALVSWGVVTLAATLLLVRLTTGG